MRGDFNMYTDDAFSYSDGEPRVASAIIAGIVGFILYAIAMSALSWIMYTIILGLKAQM